MAVEITGTDIIRSDFRSTGSNYLLGNLFQKFQAVIDIRVQTYIRPITDLELNFGDKSFATLDFVTDTVGSARFTEFFVGDNIIISGATPNPLNGTYQIISKPNNSTVQLNATFTADTLMSAGMFLVTDKPKGMRFFFGMPENSESSNFNSKIDGLQQQYKYGNLTTIPTALTTMNPLFKKSWQIGSCQVQAVTEDTVNHIYTFKITHDFFISPFYLDNQLNTLANNTAPAYFNKAKCLKYVFRVQSHYDVDDPNIFQQATIETQLGNTGWLNENFNGGQTNYSISALGYQRVSDSLALQGIENVLGTADETKVTFGIYNYIDAPFFQNDVGGLTTKINISFIVLPEDPAKYQNVNTLMANNYCFDRTVSSANASPSSNNGDQFGTGFQILKNFKATYVSTQEIQCEAIINLGADVISTIGDLTDKKFLMVVQTENRNLGVEASDAICLKVDNGNFVTTVPDLITFANTFIEHPENDITEASTGFEALSNDEVVANSSILLETAAYSPLLNSIDLFLIAKKTDGTEAILQQNNINLTGVQLVGSVQSPNIIQPTAYNISDTEIRRNILLYRDATIDSGTKKGFRVVYPFIFRWEYWKELILTGALPADFFDTTKDFNGYNQDWNRLGDFTDWAIEYRVQVNVQTSQGQQIETLDTAIPHKTFDENSEWTTTIKSYDGATLLNNGTDPYIQADIDTDIESVFTKVSGTPTEPTLANITVVMRILAYQQGGFIDSFTLSSAYDRENVGANWFKSILSDGKVEVTKSGAVYTAKAKINKSNLPNSYSKISIISRIYEKQGGAFCSFGTLQGTTLVPITSLSNAVYDGLSKEIVLFWGDGIEITTKSSSYISGQEIFFGFKIYANYWSVCSNNAATGTTASANSINIGTGFSFETLLMIVDGVEMTTKVGTSYSSPNFAATFKMKGDWKAYTPQSVLVNSTVVGKTYTDAALVGNFLNNILIIVDGVLMNQKIASYSHVTGVIDFGFHAAGLIKVYEI